MTLDEFKMAPYGEASFTYLRNAGYAYVDKTPFIKTLEKCGSRFPFIVRPRRFGKSLFANMLMAYYDKAAAASFERNFAGTWIAEHPTPFANKFMVLKFDFSGIGGPVDTLAPGFMLKMKAGMWQFVKRYFWGNTRIESVLEKDHSSPAALLTEFLFTVDSLVSDQVYIIIDEHDQFAINLLASNPKAFKAITGKDGFLKHFYTVIKDYSQSLIAGTFITGVTSISIDSLTSGFNVAANISQHAEFAGCMGFTEDELRKLIPQIIDIRRYGHSVEEILHRMKVLYDGYRFSPMSDVTVFNSSMALYYLREIARDNCEPLALMDPSFSIDLSKIEGILSLGQREFVDEIVLNVLLDKPIAIGSLSGTINLNAVVELTSEDILTTLVFMGFLTFSGKAPDLLVCPNLAVKEVFFKYWFRRIGKTEDLTFPPTALKKAVDSLKAGDAKPLLEFVSDRLNRFVGGHVHAHLNETAVQLAVCMALCTEGDYRVTAEEEALGEGYTDMILRPSHGKPNIAGWLIEFKYLKKTEATPEAVDEKINEACEQLARYSKAENVADIAQLHRAAAVFSGTKLVGLRVI